MLIEIANLDMNILGENNWTSLYLATYLGYNKVILRLLQRDDVDPNIENSDYFPLHVAVLKKNIDAVKIFVNDHRTNLNAQGKDGDTALHYAISLKQLEIVKILLNSERIDVNAVNNERNTPLHQAVLFNYEEAVDLLIQHKDIDFGIKNNEIFFIFYFLNGETPYECAKYYSTTEIIDMIEDEMPENLLEEDENEKIFC